MVKHASRDENLLFFHNCLVATGRGKKHNPQTYEFGIAGERRVVTADADNIKAILATQFRDFEKGDRFRRDWKGLLGRSIFTLDGPDWHHNRQFLRPHFARQRISDLACFERHLAHLFPLLDGEQTIDASTVMAHFAFDAAADFSLGTTQVQSLLNPSHTFIKAFERVHRTQTLIEYTTPLGWWLIPRRQYNADIKTMAEFVDPLLDKALAMSDEDLQKCLADDSSGTNSGSTRFSFLAACAAVSRDRSFLRDEITTIILAARDTTAMTLTWCLFELARHPDAVAELREEIRSTLGSGRKPTYEDIKNMPVLSHTLNETLRLYPAIPYNARVAAQDTSLPRGGGEDGMGPIGLPKGTLVYFSTHLLRKIFSFSFFLFPKLTIIKAVVLADYYLPIQTSVVISIHQEFPPFPSTSFTPGAGTSGGLSRGHIFLSAAGRGPALGSSLRLSR